MEPVVEPVVEPAVEHVVQPVVEPVAKSRVKALTALFQTSADKGGSTVVQSKSFHHTVSGKPDNVDDVPSKTETKAPPPRSFSAKFTLPRRASKVLDLAAKFESASIVDGLPPTSSSSSRSDVSRRDISSSGGAINSPDPASPKSPKSPKSPDRPMSPTMLTTAMSATTATDENEAAALDFSPVETYASRNMRAERVANALERIGKQADDFSETADDDGIAPREAIIPLMIESMQQHRNDPKVADRALNTLRRLTVSDACRGRIGECGGVEAVVGIMRFHSLLVRIQTQACLVLANLAYRSPANKQAIVRSGGVQVIVEALSKHRAAEHVQVWGCMAIRNVTNLAPVAEYDASIAAEAVGVLLLALERYTHSQIVQQNAMIALVNIAMASPFGMERIREEGGIRVVIACMKNNIQSSKLSEIGLSLVRLLVEEEKNQKVFGFSHGIEVVTATMTEHSGHVGIAIKGCAALWNLAFQRENRDRLGRCGGIDVIISTLTQNKSGDADGAMFSLKALSNCTYDSLANKTLAGRLGGIEATLGVLNERSYKEDERMAEDGCRVLRNLVDGVPPNQRLLIKNKGVSIVLDAVRAHGGRCAGVAEHGMAIFVNMCTNKNFAVQMSEGSGDIIVAARMMREAHASNELVTKQVNKLSEAAVGRRSGRLQRQTSGRRESRNESSIERTLRGARSHHRSRSGSIEEQQTRVQRLRSLPLPLGRQRGELVTSRYGA